MPFAFVYTPALLFIDFTWSQFLLALLSSVVAVMGLGAAYTGYFMRPLSRLTFVVLNLASLSLVFANPTVCAISIPVVLGVLLWHARSARITT